MAAGWGHQVIAARLHLAPKTLRNHVSNVIGFGSTDGPAGGR
jgi:DNA-binding NarL/FixJ family response regulator